MLICNKNIKSLYDILLFLTETDAVRKFLIFFVKYT